MNNRLYEIVKQIKIDNIKQTLDFKTPPLQIWRYILLLKKKKNGLTQHSKQFALFKKPVWIKIYIFHIKKKKKSAFTSKECLCTQGTVHLQPHAKYKGKLKGNISN